MLNKTSYSINTINYHDFFDIFIQIKKKIPDFPEMKEDSKSFVDQKKFLIQLFIDKYDNLIKKKEKKFNKYINNLLEKNTNFEKENQELKTQNEIFLINFYKLKNLKENKNKIIKEINLFEENIINLPEKEKYYILKEENKNLKENIKNLEGQLSIKIKKFNKYKRKNIKIKEEKEELIENNKKLKYNFEKFQKEKKNFENNQIEFKNLKYNYEVLQEKIKQKKKKFKNLKININNLKINFEKKKIDFPIDNNILIKKSNPFLTIEEEIQFVNKYSEIINKLSNDSNREFYIASILNNDIEIIKLKKENQFLNNLIKDLISKI